MNDEDKNPMKVIKSLSLNHKDKQIPSIRMTRLKSNLSDKNSKFKSQG